MKQLKFLVLILSMLSIRSFQSHGQECVCNTNMLLNSGFESTLPGAPFDCTQPGGPHPWTDWNDASFSMILMSVDCGTVPSDVTCGGSPIDTYNGDIDNEHHLWMLGCAEGSLSDVPGDWYEPSINQPLLCPMLPNQWYELSFWARAQSCGNNPSVFPVVASFTDASELGNSNFFLYEPEQHDFMVSEDVVVGDGWVYHSIEFQFTGSEELDGFWFGINASEVPAFELAIADILLDELSLKPIDPIYIIELAATTTDASCPNNADGAADLTVTSGLAPYSYAWTGPNSYTSDEEDPDDMLPGTYDVAVTDANGCTASLTGVVISSAIVMFYTSLTITSQAQVDNFLTGQTVFIQNTLQFNPGIYDLDNATMLFGATGKVWILEDTYVEAENSTFSSCGPAWYGIIVFSDSSTPETSGGLAAINCSVSNALVGVQTNDGAWPAQTDVTLAQAGGIHFFFCQ